MSWADALALTERDGDVYFDVRVTPRAPRSALAGVHGSALKLTLASAPVDGAANRALIELLAELLAVKKSALRIVRGEHARNKSVCVAGLDADRVRQALATHASESGAR